MNNIFLWLLYPVYFRNFMYTNVLSTFFISKCVWNWIYRYMQVYRTYKYLYIIYNIRIQPRRLTIHLFLKINILYWIIYLLKINLPQYTNCEQKLTTYVKKKPLCLWSTDHLLFNIEIRYIKNYVISEAKKT